MSLIAKKSEGGERELVPTGVHPAILIWVVDLGTQDTKYGEKELQLFTFELCRQLIEHEGEIKPRVISPFPMTPWITENSNLGSMLQSWFGSLPEKDFNTRALVGKHCMLNVVHKPSKKTGKMHARIASVLPPDDDCKQIEQYHKSIVFEFGKDQLDMDLPEWIRADVMRAREWNEQGQQNEGPVVTSSNADRVVQEPTPFNTPPPIAEEDDLPF